MSLRALFVFVALLLLPVVQSSAAPGYEMPVAPSRDLKESFPDCPDAKAPLTLRGLRVCLSDLEAFRRGVLEPYNKAVKAYSKQLTALDARMRKDAAGGKIGWDLYEEQKVKIGEALQRAALDGDLMAPYLEFSEKLVERNRYVKSEILRCETDPRQGCN